MGLKARNLSAVFANNKGANQPAHRYSVISAFVICLLESIISRLATSKFSIFYLVSVAKETGLSLPLLEIPKTGFLATRHCLVHYGSISVCGPYTQKS